MSKTKLERLLETKNKTNPITDLKGELAEYARLGLFDSADSKFLEKVTERIDLKLRLYYKSLLYRRKKYFNTYFRRGFNNYKKHITDRHKIRTFRLSDLNPLFTKNFKAQSELSLEIISTRTQEDILKLKNRFIDWVTLRQVGGDKERLSEMVKLPNDKHTRFLLKNQLNKMIAHFDKEVSEFYGGALAFQWHTMHDKRVVGDPAGLYPKAQDPKTHGNHYARAGKWFFNPKAKAKLLKEGAKIGAFAGDYDSISDGMPGIPVGCRCYAFYVYDIRDLPKDMVKLQ